WRAGLSRQAGRLCVGEPRSPEEAEAGRHDGPVRRLHAQRDVADPNPVNEGIMQFYGRKVLERHGLWQKISGGKECHSCQTTPNNWFTAVHHRETPERIRDGKSDTGFVWVTEAMEAVRNDAPVEGVRLPPADSLRDEVA